MEMTKPVYHQKCCSLAETHTHRKQGIALVIALAFLSILILMAITLVTITRTERLVSDSALQSHKVKQLLKGAMEAAMNDISRELWVDKRIHTPEDMAVFISLPTPAGEKMGDDSLIQGEVSDWLPNKYLMKGDAYYDASAKAADAEWILVKDPKDDKILGRYAYLAADCTGLLDANLISQPDPLDSAKVWARTNGMNVGEIDAMYLPEIGSQLKRQAFVENRNNYYRFDTLPEVLLLNDGTNTGYSFDEEFSISKNLLTNLAPYSLCYDNGWWDWDANTRRAPGELADGSKVNGNANNWTKNEARRVFEKVLEISDPAVLDMMADNFIDYTDDTRVPENVDSFCTEAVPMINEVLIRGSLTTTELAPASYVVSHTVSIKVETWYPFPANEPLSGYKVEDMTLSGILGSGHFMLTVVGPSGPIPPDKSTPDTSPASFTPVYSHNVLQVHEFLYNLTCSGLKPDDEVRVAGLLQKAVILDSANKPVDAVNVPAGEGKEFLIDTFKIPAPGADAAVWQKAYVLEVPGDPRLNYDFTKWNHADSGTLGSRNINTTGNGDDGQEGLDMYVADGPMQSVAELGYLSVGNPWVTINLCKSGGRKLLAQFRTDDFIEKTYQRGFVNPNSLYPDVLRSVFKNTPVERYPGDATNATVKLFEDGLNDLVDLMVSHSRAPGNTGKDSFDSPAGWVEKMEEPALKGYYNNNEREAIIRNSYRLFNANQNLYTLIVAAQTINDQGAIGSWSDSDDTITGERRAVALVWIDPFLNENGRHEMFVRQFRYLDE